MAGSPISEEAKLNYERSTAEMVERMKIQTEFAHSVLRGLTLGNGGAIIALFTFIGNSNRSLPFEQQSIWCAFAIFIGGLTATFISAIGGYFSQSFYLVSTTYEAWSSQAEMLGNEQRWDHIKPYNRGTIAEYTGVAAAFIGLACFAVGSCFALSGVLVNLPSVTKL